MVRGYISGGNGAGGLSGLTQLTMNQGLEYSSHCIENATQNFEVNLASASINNTDGRSGQGGLHPGQWRFRLDNSTGRAVVQHSSAAATRMIYLGSGSWTFEVLVNFETLSTALDEYITMWGLADARSDDVISDGVYFEYDRTNSVNFIGVTESGGTRTEVDSLIAVSTTATTWRKLRFEINAAATSVEFFVDGVSIGTSSTNITSNDLQFFIRADASTATGAKNVFYLDYVYLRNELTTEV
ncbi:MAG: hypothetical protein ABFQ95_01135 [Pseudomonadota bacterium]